MITNPKISIIIPTLNQGQFIEETILSILHQTYKNFEIIVVDGGSTDNTLAIIKKYETQLFKWLSEKDKGQSNAINKGLQFITGDIVTWLNSDDYYELNTLELIKNEFVSDPDLMIVHGKTNLFGNGIKRKIIGLTKNIPLHEYLPYMRFPQPSSFLKKELFATNMPVNEKLHYAMDFELIAKAILLGSKIKRMDALLSNYRLHENSKSNNEIKFLEEWAIVVRNIFLSLGKNFFGKKLEELKLVNTSTTANFEIKINFSNSEVETIFLQHLNLHFHYNYRAFNYMACEKISAFLKETYPDFYKLNNYNKYNFRRKFIPKFVFTIFRKLKR
ncbi:MAG: glycosyltransferase [Bacteroidetes bacterium]|nr:glycosyltransferase [Bacteroidota bacterium]